jgi:hypothetical protein
MRPSPTDIFPESPCRAPCRPRSRARRRARIPARGRRAQSQYLAEDLSSESKRTCRGSRRRTSCCSRRLAGRRPSLPALWRRRELRRLGQHVAGAGRRGDVLRERQPFARPRPISVQEHEHRRERGGARRRGRPGGARGAGRHVAERDGARRSRRRGGVKRARQASAPSSSKAENETIGILGRPPVKLRASPGGARFPAS